MVRFFIVMGILGVVFPAQALPRRPAQEHDLRAARLGVVYDLPAPQKTEKHTSNPVVDSSESFSTDRRARTLRKRLQHLLRSQPLATVRLSIAVSNAATGEEWAARNPDRTLNPASTLKLITSAVALDRLGPDYRFTTHVRFLDGTAYLVGSGDPQLSLNALDRLAQRLVDHSPRSIRRIVVDDEAFSGGVLPPGYDKKQTDAAYRASVGSIALMDGTTKISVYPSREGQPPRVVQTPPGGYVLIDNRAKTVSGKGSTIRIRVTRHQRRSKAVITGRIGRKRKRRPTWANRRVEHPPLAAGYAFKALIEKHCDCGIPGDVTLGPTPPRAQRIAHHRSEPLSALMATMNKTSNNFIAEMLLRALARERDNAFQTVSWDDGLRTVRTWLETKLGFQADDYQYSNGSGLYDGGRFSAAQVVRLLVHMNQHANRELYRASLAVAGRDGTLKGRLIADATAGRMVGKTGTLNEVSALSGYVRTRNGQRLAFSILMNNTGGATQQMRRIQDRIVSLLIEIR
jgi:D-alanyl-D-alanine carboxypeptidase/D-alanyl-D-alanine-endopeptidase (penicillin-binding protein 4)